MVTFPALGIDGGDGGIAAAAGATLPAVLQYSNYLTDWPTWASFSLGNPGKLTTFQISPYPLTDNGGRGIAFNASDLATNYKSYFDTLAQNVAAAGQQNFLSCNLGWEWNSGGACASGSTTNGLFWDMAGQQALYIQMWRMMATSFKTYAPNIIRAWCSNTTLMASGGQLADWYPGDDLVDAVGLDLYGTWANEGGSTDAPNLTDLNTGYGWLYQMSNATFLGPNHPAKASGSMVIQGVNTPIPFGGQKYIVLPEWQNSTDFSDYVTRFFTWVTQCNGRVLAAIYWNSYVASPTGQLLNSGNAPGQQFIAGISGHAYPNPYPIPRLSGSTSPTITMATPGTVAVNTSFAVSGTLANYPGAPTLQYALDSGGYANLPAGNSVSSGAFSFTDPGIAAAGLHTISVKDSNGVIGTTSGFTVYSGPSASNTVVTTAGIAIIDTSLNAWTITSVGTVAYNGVVIGYTSGVTVLAYVSGVMWQFGSGSWYSFGPVDGGGVPTTASGPTSTSPVMPSPSFTVAVLPNSPIVDSLGNAFVIDSNGKIDINGLPITFTSSVTLIAVVAGVIWQFAGGSWYSLTDTAGTMSPATGPTSTSPLTTASATGSAVTAVGSPLIDSLGNVFSITSTGTIAVNGVSTSLASGVTELAYVSGVMWWLSGGQWTSIIDTAGVISKGNGPTTTSPLAASKSMTVTWQAPTNGTAPTSYTVQYKLATASSFTNGTPTASLSQTISGLVTKTAYNVQVFATNAQGNGPPSSPAITVTMN